MMKKYCVGLFLAVSLTCGLRAENDWPQWRGPKRDGISAEKGLLQDWPAGGPKLLWESKGLGNGYATVVTSGDKIFTSGERGDSSILIALNRADGKELWTAKIGQAGEMGGFNGPRSTPTADKDL